MARSNPVQHDVIINFRVNAQGQLPDVNQGEINALSAQTIQRAHQQAEATNRQAEIRTVTSQGHGLRYVAHTREQLGAMFSDVQARIEKNPALAAHQAQFAPFMQTIQNMLQQGPQLAGRPGPNNTRIVPGRRGFTSIATARELGEAAYGPQLQQQLGQLMDAVGLAESAQAPLMANATRLNKTQASGGFVRKAHRLLTQHASQARVLGLDASPEHAALQNALNGVVMAEAGSPAHTAAMGASREAFAQLQATTKTRGSAPGDAVPHAFRVAGEMTHRGALGYDRITELNRRLNDPATTRQERRRAQSELDRLLVAGGQEGFRAHAAAGADHAARVQAHVAHWTPERRAADPQGAMDADKALEAQTNRIEYENALVRREINKTEQRIQREEEAQARQEDVAGQVSRGQRLSNAILGRSIAGRLGGFLSSVATASGEDFAPGLASGVMKTATGAAADITMGRYIAGTGGPVGMAVAFAVDAIAGGIKSSIDRGMKLQSTATQSRGTRLMRLGQLFATSGLPEVGALTEVERAYDKTSADIATASEGLLGTLTPTPKSIYKRNIDKARDSVQATRTGAFSRFSQGGIVSAGQMEEMMSLLSSSGVNIGKLADSYDAGSPIARMLADSYDAGSPITRMLLPITRTLLPSMFAGRAGRLMSGYGLGAHAAGISINTGLPPQVIASMMAAGAGGRGGALRVDAQGNYSSAAAALGGWVQNGMVTMPGATQVGSSLAEMVAQGYTGDIGRAVSFYGNLGSAGVDVRHTANYMGNLFGAHQSAGDMLGLGQLKGFASQLQVAQAVAKGGGTYEGTLDAYHAMSASDMNSALGGGTLGRLLRKSMGLTYGDDAATAAGVGDATSLLEIISSINAAIAFTVAGKNEEQLRKEGYGMSAADEARARRIETTLDEVANSLASAARSLGSLAGEQ